MVYSPIVQELAHHKIEDEMSRAGWRQLMKEVRPGIGGVVRLRRALGGRIMAIGSLVYGRSDETRKRAAALS